MKAAHGKETRLTACPIRETRVLLYRRKKPATRQNGDFGVEFSEKSKHCCRIDGLKLYRSCEGKVEIFALRTSRSELRDRKLRRQTLWTKKRTALVGRFAFWVRRYRQNAADRPGVLAGPPTETGDGSFRRLTGQSRPSTRPWRPRSAWRGQAPPPPECGPCRRRRCARSRHAPAAAPRRCSRRTARRIRGIRRV